MYSKKQLEIYSKFFEWDFTKVPEEFKGKKNPNKDLLIADVHAPFHHKELFKQTIDDNLDAQNLWIAGDWWDFYSKSFYRKTQHIDFHIEFREAFAQLWKLSDKFDKIYLMLSNHDMRFTKWMYDNVPSEALAFTDSTFQRRILQVIPNLKVVEQTTDRERKVGYVFQHKNMVLTHIEMSRKNVGQVVQEVCKELHRWEDAFRLKKYDMLLQAHNHQSAKVKYGSKFLYQIPCLVDIAQPSFDYVFSGKLQGNPPALGYVVLNKFEDGSFDPKKSYIVDL